MSEVILPEGEDKDLSGAGGGGGNSQTTSRVPDTLLSQDYFEILLGLSEGPIKGLVPGVYSAIENFYVGNTPLGNVATGLANFPDFALTHYLGSEQDPAITFRLGGQSSNLSIATRLAQNIPVVRTTPANLRGIINRIEFRILFNTMQFSTDNGVTETFAAFKLEYKRSIDSVWSSYFAPNVVIKGKTTSGAAKDFYVDVPPNLTSDWDLRVTKLSPDNVGTIGDLVDMTWESAQLVSLAPQKFDDLAVVHIYGRASNQFQSIPDFSGVYEGMLVRVPTNYNTTTRTYDESTPWNGQFKLEYTNNPAWILYELCMNTRWGLPRYYLTVTANRYEFYSAAKWCDEPVWITGTSPPQYQPRFTFNEVFQDAKNGIEALNYIAGAFNSVILDDGTGTIILRTDQPRTPKQIFTPESVQNGEFNYSFTDISTRYNDVTAVFINPDLDWSEDRRQATIDNTADIAANGRIPTEFVAVGCTNVHEAVRRANYHYITANTEKTTVTFITSRFGMFTQPFETIYVADPLSGWSKPGRIKSIVNGKVNLRDPIYFSEMSARTMKLQTLDGLVDMQIAPQALGANYVLNILSGNAPPNLPPSTTFTIQDTNTLGLAKPFKVLSVEEVEGSPDAFKVTALEINVNKYPDSDIGAQSESVQYSYQLPGEPILPPALVIETGNIHNQIMGDGTIVYRAFASWFRPFQAFTEYYILEYREVGASNWETIQPIMGDSVYVSPLKDNTRYNFRLFAYTPLGKRSTKYLEVLNYLIAGKVAVLENVSGMILSQTDSGWQVKWNIPTFSDFAGVELRLGLSIQPWEALTTYAKTKADRVQFGFLAAAKYRMYAKYMDTSKNVSGGANFVEWDVFAPAVPVITADTVFNQPLLTWENAQTTQPIRLYRIKRGDSYATATVMGTTVDLRFTHIEKVAGTYRYWVEAEDMAGNLGQPGSALLTVLPGVTEAITELQNGLDEAIASLLNINSGWSDRIIYEAVERGTAIQVLQNIVTEGYEQLAQQIVILTARAVGYIRGNLTKNGGFEFDLEGWTGTTAGWVTADSAYGKIATLAAPPAAGKFVSPQFIAKPNEWYSVAADTRYLTDNGTSMLGIDFYTSTGVVISSVDGPVLANHEFLDERERRTALAFEAQAPANTAFAAAYFRWAGTSGGGIGLRQVKSEMGRLPITPYSSEASDIGSVAAIRQEATARASADAAEAALRDTLAVKVNGVEANLNIESSVRATQTGELQARWGVRMTVGGKVSGVVMNNDGQTSDFVILTDKFAIARETDTPGVYKYPFVVGVIDGVSSIGVDGNLFVDGTIKGRSIAADTIEATKLRAKSITADQIKAGAITADLINVGVGTNILPNSTFMDTTGNAAGRNPTGWTPEWNSPSPALLAMPSNFAAWIPQNAYGLAMQQTAGFDGSTVINLRCENPIIEGRYYEFSAYVGAHRCVCRLVMQWLNSANTVLSTVPITAAMQNAAEMQGGLALNLFKRIGGVAQAPVGATQLRMVLQKGGTSSSGATDSYGFWLYPMIAEATPNQTVLSPYQPAGAGVRITPWGITTPNLSAISAVIGLLRTSTSGQRSEIDDNGMRVYDGNNVLRTRNGIW